MTLEEIRKICLDKKGSGESIKWENHLCFTVAEKMFMIVNPDSFPVNGSFKCSPESFDELTSREGIIPAPYLARYHWVQFDNIDRFDDAEWKQHIDRAYKLVFEKLPAKIRKQIIN